MSHLQGRGPGSAEVELLERLLREEKYQPKPVRRVWIEKPGKREKRPLGIPTIRDRIVQSALLYVIEPIFEAEFAEHSYGFRPGRNARQAVDRVEHLLEEGNPYRDNHDRLHAAFEKVGERALHFLLFHTFANLVYRFFGISCSSDTC